MQRPCGGSNLRGCSICSPGDQGAHETDTTQGRQQSSSNSAVTVLWLRPWGTEVQIWSDRSSNKTGIFIESEQQEKEINGKGGAERRMPEAGGHRGLKQPGGTPCQQLPHHGGDDTKGSPGMCTT